MQPVPRETIRQNPRLLLVETKDGGHMGWASRQPRTAQTWDVGFFLLFLLLGECVL